MLYPRYIYICIPSVSLLLSMLLTFQYIILHPQNTLTTPKTKWVKINLYELQPLSWEKINLLHGRWYFETQCNTLTVLWSFLFLISWLILASCRINFSSSGLFLTSFGLESNHFTINSLHICPWISLDRIPNHKHQSTITFSFWNFPMNDQDFTSQDHPLQLNHKYPAPK